MPFENGVWVDYEIIANATTPIDMMTYADRVTGFAFGLMLIITIFMITLMATYRRDIEVSLPVATFIATISSYLMAAVDVVADEVAWAMTFVLVGTVAFLFAKKGGSSNV